MIEDLEYLLDKLKDQSIANEIVIIYKDKVSKIKRENYYPDKDGLVVFKRKTDVSETGYSVYEIIEFFERYKDKIQDFLFQAWDDSLQPFVNIYESELYITHGSYSCVIITGDGSEVLSMPGKVKNDTWASDMMYPELAGIKSQL